MNKKNQLMLNPLSLSIGILTFVNSVCIYIYYFYFFEGKGENRPHDP